MHLLLWSIVIGKIGKNPDSTSIRLWKFRHQLLKEGLTSIILSRSGSFGVVGSCPKSKSELCGVRVIRSQSRPELEPAWVSLCRRYHSHSPSVGVEMAGVKMLSHTIIVVVYCYCYNNRGLLTKCPRKANVITSSFGSIIIVVGQGLSVSTCGVCFKWLMDYPHIAEYSVLRMAARSIWDLNPWRACC